jgi:hypothetical protein
LGDRASNLPPLPKISSASVLSFWATLYQEVAVLLESLQFRPFGRPAPGTRSQNLDSVRQHPAVVAVLLVGLGVAGDRPAPSQVAIALPSVRSQDLHSPLVID